MRRNFFTLFFVAFIFFLDRISKNYIVSHFSEGSSLAVWPGVFHLTRVNNTGAAFGMLKGFQLFLIALAFVCIFFLLLFVLRRIHSGPWMKIIPSLMVIAGAAGNLYDRVFYGHVIDFLDFRFWPVFNIADASISVGIFFIIVSVLREGKKSA